MAHCSRLLAAAAAVALPAFTLAQSPAPIVPVGPPTVMPATQSQTPPAEKPKAEEPKADDKKDEEKKDDESKPEETHYLLEKVLGRTPAGQQLLERGWRVYGWTQTSFTTGSVRSSTLPVPFIDRVEKFSLNQNWLHVEKTIDTSKKEVQIGGAVDLILPGTDARIPPARGLLDHQTGTTNPIDLYQAYVDVFAPNVGPQGTTFRLGKFNTACEYETVQAISTPFVSRSYLFQYNPFTHTGVNAITPLNDDWTVSNGLVLGNDNFVDPASRVTYIGRLAWVPKDGKTTAAFNVSVTNPRYHASEEFNFYNAYNLQLTHKLTDKLLYVLDSTFSHEDAIPGVGSANWYGIVNYLL